MSDRPNRPDEPEAVSIREAAALTGRSEAAIYHLIASGQLPARPTASRGLAIHRQDLLDLARGRHIRERQGHWWRRLWPRGLTPLRRLGAGVWHLVTNVPSDQPGWPGYGLPPLFAF